MQIAPEAVATFLQRQKNDAETYAKDLASTMAELNGLSEAEAQCLVTTEGERAIRSLSHQLASWKAFMRGDADLVVRAADKGSSCKCSAALDMHHFCSAPADGISVLMHAICRRTARRRLHQVTAAG